MSAESAAVQPVLVVEDDEALREAYVAIVAEAGYEARAAFDRESALAQAALAPRPVLAMLDLGLPPSPGKADVGLETLHLLLVELPRLKAVVLTGQDEPSLSWRAIALGAFDYLVKPASRESIMRALERGRLFVESERALAQQGQARLTVTAHLSEGVREYGEAAQEKLVRAVFEDSGQNVVQAARTLGISRENLYYFLRKFGIER